MDQVLFGPLTVADAIVVGVFLLFAVWRGAVGLYKSVMPLLVSVCALVGALLLTHFFAAAVTDWAWPGVQDWFHQRVDLSALQGLDAAGLGRALEAQLPPTLLNLMEKLGLDLGAFVGEALGSAAAGAGQAAESAAMALLRAATEGAVRALVFLVSWGLLTVLLTLLKNALGLAVELPVVRGLNRAGGAVLGLALCFALVYALLWLAALLDLTPILDFARQSFLLRWIGSL